MTTITGKDAPLETTTGKIEASLQNLGIELSTASELNPVPHCYSAHLRAKGYEVLCTNGKGTSRLSSRASGMAEFVERLATDFFFSDYYLGTVSERTEENKFCYFPDEIWFSGEENETLQGLVSRTSTTAFPLLSPDLLEFYDEEKELTHKSFFDNNFDGERGICTLPFTKIGDKQKVYFPISLLNNLYVSNGMAAGNSNNECQAQALSEIIERHVKNKVIAEGLCLPDVPEKALTPYPHLLEIKSAIEQHAFSVTIHDSSLGGTFPVVCVILVDKETGGTYAAFGANCRFEIAIERTLTELLQGRQLNQLKSFQPPSHSLDLVADPYNLESHFIDSNGLLGWTMFKDVPDFEFSPWSFAGTTAEEKDLLISIIKEQGFALYLREFTHCNFYACRILVPGMSEIYPVDDLVWNNKNKGANLRRSLLQQGNEAEQELLRTIEELEFDDMQLISHIIGVVFDSGSNWETLRIGELKAHLYLALGQAEEALAWCNWVVDYAEINLARKRLFRAVASLLAFSIDGVECQYVKGLHKFFSEKEIDTAKAIISGKITFCGLKFACSWEQISIAHSRLLDLYERLKELKTATQT